MCCHVLLTVPVISVSMLIASASASWINKFFFFFFKITYDLPYETHRNILPVISGVKPLRTTLAKRLISFTERIKKSEKSVLKQILALSESDVRTVTGRNLRSILLLTDKSRISQLHPSDMEKVNYYGEPEQWRIVTILEGLQLRAGELELPEGWKMDEMQQIFEAACCNWYFFFIDVMIYFFISYINYIVS